MNKVPGLNFKFGRIPVRVEASFLVAMVALGWARGGLALVTWVVVGTIGVFGHELGHAAAIIAMGRKPSINLLGFGGNTTYDLFPLLDAKRELLIYLAGPAAGVVMGALVFGAGMLGVHVPRLMWFDALLVTWGWSALNLIPLKPLDGGVAVEKVVKLVTRRSWPRGFAVVGILGWALLVVFALVEQSPVDGLIAGMLLYSQVQAFLQPPQVRLEAIDAIVRALKADDLEGALDHTAALSKESVPQATSDWLQKVRDEVATKAQKRMREARTRAEREACLPLLENVLQSQLLEPLATATLGAAVLHTLNSGEPDAAAELCFRLGRIELLPPRALGWLLVELEEPARAVPILESSPPTTPQDHAVHLRATAMIRLGRGDEAVALGDGLTGERICHDAISALAWRALDAGHIEQGIGQIDRQLKRSASADWARELASAYARAGRLDDSRAMLEQAIQGGFKHRRLMEVDSDFDVLRTDPVFLGLMERIAPLPVEPKVWKPLTRRSQSTSRRPVSLARPVDVMPPGAPVIRQGRAVLLPQEWRVIVLDDGVAATEAMRSGYLLHEGRTLARIVRQRRLPRGLSVLEVEGCARVAADGGSLIASRPSVVAAEVRRELLERARRLAVATPEMDLYLERRLELTEDMGTLADLIAASLPMFEPLRAAVLDAPTPNAQLQAATALLDHALAAIDALPQTQCPCCGWKPPPEARWFCDGVCRNIWHTFATGGHCERCGKIHQLTMCLACLLPSKHGGWYVRTESAAPAPATGRGQG